MKRKAKESIARAVKKAGVQPPPKSKEATTVITPEAAKKASQSPSIIERTPLVPRTHSSAVNEHLCNIMCWNVAGLRGTLKNNKNIFDELVQKHDPHIICLQETKIQQAHETDFNADAELAPGYVKFWASSVAKKGYSGTALFIKQSICGDITRSRGDVRDKEDAVEDKDETSGSTRKKKGKQKSISSFFAAAASTKASDPTPAVPTDVESLEARPTLPLRLVEVSCELQEPRFAGEGRTITAEFDKFYLVNCYVPNSGQKLERLEYRTSEWDPFLYQHLKQLEQKKPVIFTGDLNVAHLDLDIHNPEAKHLVKQAGLTPQERSSFGTLLATGFQDAFRFFYPEHKGQFTFWSQRAGGRPVNKGLRLDYFLCSRTLFRKEEEDGGLPLEVIDSSIVHEDTVGCSDHCPILLTLKICD